MVLEELKPGDKCQYGFKGEWQEGILIEFWNPQYPHLQTYAPNFSYFTVQVGGKIKRGYGLHQLRI